MEARILELHEREQDIAAGLQLIRAAEKRERQKQKNAKKKQAAAWQASTTLVHTLLIKYALSGYVAEPAVKYMANYARRRRWPERDEQVLAEMVEQYFLDVDVDELTALADTADPQDAAAMREAMPYVEQWRLCVWATRLNEQHGVAPSTDSVLMRLEANRMQLPEEVRPRAVGCVADGRARKWALGWRRRWGGRHGKIRVREDVPVAELREKVVQ